MSSASVRNARAEAATKEAQALAKEEQRAVAAQSAAAHEATQRAEARLVAQQQDEVAQKARADAEKLSTQMAKEESQANERVAAEQATLCGSVAGVRRGCGARRDDPRAGRHASEVPAREIPALSLWA